MKVNVYSIFDSAVQGYMQPFYAPNNATAVRAIKQDLSRPDTAFKTPEDYTLFHIGTWEPDTGHLTATPPERVLAVIALVDKE